MRRKVSKFDFKFVCGLSGILCRLEASWCRHGCKSTCQSMAKHKAANMHHLQCTTECVYVSTPPVGLCRGVEVWDLVHYQPQEQTKCCPCCGSPSHHTEAPKLQPPSFSTNLPTLNILDRKLTSSRCRISTMHDLQLYATTWESSAECAKHICPRSIT